jgi:uncharacterized damage-inducible protein DinB
MSLHDHFTLMASYNQWMNAKLYDAADKLSAAELLADKGAFFGSVFGTLNHLCVADRIWLQRFAKHPAQSALLEPIVALQRPTILNEMLFDHLTAMRAHRNWLDEIIVRWIGALSEDDLSQPLTYANTKGVVSSKGFAHLLTHFFNHQTHHRGQTTTLLSQAGIDVGVTDLLMVIPNED